MAAWLIRGPRWPAAMIVGMLLLCTSAWGDPGIDRTKVPGLSSFDDPNAWDPAGVPDGNDRLLWNLLGPGFAYDDLYVGPGSDSNVRVAAGLTVSGTSAYCYYYLYMQNGAVLSLRDNGSPGSGILRVQSGYLNVQEGELRAVSGVFGEGPGSTIVSVKAPARLTFSGDLSVLCQANPQVHIYGTLSAANIHVGDPNSPAWATLNSIYGGLISVPGTLHVYPYAYVQPYEGNIVVGTLHVHQEPGFYGNGPMGTVEGRGAIHATTVNNEGAIEADGGVLDVYGDIVQYSSGTLTDGTWAALSGGTLNLHAIGDVMALANGAAIELSGLGASIPKIAHLNRNDGFFRMSYGTNFTTEGNFINSGTVLANATDAGSSSSFVVTGGLDNYGMVAAYGRSAAGSPNSTFVVKGNVAQLDGNTLTGGSWILMGNASIVFEKGGAIAVNQGRVNLQGPYTRFDPINTLADNQASFTLYRRPFTTVGALRNSGSMSLQSCRLTVNGDYTQTGGSVQFTGQHDSATGADTMGQLEVHGEVFARGSLWINLPYGSDCVAPFPLITFTGDNPDIQFSNISVMYLHANRQWQLYQGDTSFGIEFLQRPDVKFDANWQQGMTVQDALQGWTVDVQDSNTGHVDLINDGLVTGHQVLQLQDLGTGPEGVHDVSLTTPPLHITDKYLHVRFDYRFLTDGKMKMSLDANLVAVILSPLDDPEQIDLGRDTYATYDHWFNLSALGYAATAQPKLQFRLVSRDGLDPEFRLDGLTIDMTGTPEPGTLLLLAAGGLLEAARRRRWPGGGSASTLRITQARSPTRPSRPALRRSSTRRGASRSRKTWLLRNSSIPAPDLDGWELSFKVAPLRAADSRAGGRVRPL